MSTDDTPLSAAPAKAAPQHAPMDQFSARDGVLQIGGQPPSQLLRTIGTELVEKRGEA